MNPTRPDRPDESRWIDLTADPLDPAGVLSFLAHDGAGGNALFVGTPRLWTGEVVTPWLEYEAYPDMALRRLDELAAEAAQRWSPFRLAVHHRLGRVYPKEASVVVGVACAHRAEAFEACRWLLDTLKSDLPIWKHDGVPTASPQHATWL